MPNNKSPRPRGSDSNEETLRGKNRSLQKTIRQLQQKIKQLELQLGLSVERPKNLPEEPVPERKLVCNSCGKGELEVFEAYRPGSPIRMVRCNLCGHQEKMK
jgi:hypothetical protein